MPWAKGWERIQALKIAQQESLRMEALLKAKHRAVLKNERRKVVRGDKGLQHQFCVATVILAETAPDLACLYAYNRMRNMSGDALPEDFIDRVCSNYLAMPEVECIELLTPTSTAKVCEFTAAQKFIAEFSLHSWVGTLNLQKHPRQRRC